MHQKDDKQRFGPASVGEDVTERHRAQERLRESEEDFRNIFENAPFGIYQVTLTRRLRVNPALAAMFGFDSCQEMLACPMACGQMYANPELRSQVLRRASESNGFIQQEVEYRRKDGSTFHANLRMKAVRDPLGEIKFFEGFVENINEYRLTEKTLHSTVESFRQLAENIDSVFWVCNRAKTEMLYVSPAYEKIWKRSCQSLYERPTSFLDAIHPADRDRILVSIERGRRGEGYEEEYRILWPDGSVRWIHDRGFAIRNDKGELYRFAGLAQDITERRQLEEQLRQAQKMEAVGNLAGGVAHDFNNILAASLMHLGLLKENRELTPEVAEVIKEVENEIARAANLTRQLLLFSRRQVARFEPLEVNALVTNLLKMLRRLLRENIQVEFRRSSAAWVWADAGMLEQVIMNLCINARDAMPNGGNLTLATGIVDRESTRHQLDVRAGRFVCLEVTDTGCGINESILKQIFEPFFTTKEVGQGTGLGLATVHGIVKQHEGWVEVESTVGHGSTFRIYLPLRQAPVLDTTLPAGDHKQVGGSEAILLVEDDASLRRAMALALRKLGYGVLEATNCVTALQVWSEHREKIDLLLTDMVMPEVTTGLQLAERLKRDKAALKVIICSGYSAELCKPHAANPEFVFLAKPFKPADVAEAVRACLK